MHAARGAFPLILVPWALQVSCLPVSFFLSRDLSHVVALWPRPPCSQGLGLSFLAWPPVLLVA